MKAHLFKVLICAFALLTVIGSAAAQQNPDCTRDPRRCLAPIDIPAADRDSDGVADFVDLCPDAAGSGFTNGCPLEIDPNILDVLPESREILDGPIWSIFWYGDLVGERCQVGVPLNASQPVNVRAEMPSNDPNVPMPDVIGQLHAGDVFAPVYAHFDQLPNPTQIWYFGALNSGWVSSTAVIDNGQCDNIVLFGDYYDSDLYYGDGCWMFVPTTDYDGVEVWAPGEFDTDLWDNLVPHFDTVAPEMRRPPGFYTGAYQQYTDADGVRWIQGFFGRWHRYSEMIDVSTPLGACDALPQGVYKP